MLRIPGRPEDGSVDREPQGIPPHISEGIDDSAHAEFVCQSNANQDDAAHDLIERQTAVVHGMAVNPDDVARYRKIVGICGYSYDNRKIWPRNAADITQ